MKSMTFPQKKVARAAYFVSEANDRYISAVDRVMELKAQLAEAECRVEKYRLVCDKQIKVLDKNLERFGKDRDSKILTAPLDVIKKTKDGFFYRRSLVNLFS